MTNRRRLLVTGFIALLLAASLVVGIVWLAGGHNAGQPLSSGQPTPSQSQVQRQRISGPVHAAGMRILDSSGRPVRIDALVLMNYGTRSDKPSFPLSDQDFDNITGWGFNSVRLNFSWAHLEPRAPTVGQDGSLTHHWDKGYLRDIDAAVSGFTRRHVAVILDLYQFGWFPQMPLWLYPSRPSFYQAQCDFVTGRREPGAPIDPQQGAADAWKMMAGRYRANPLVIGADLLTEPDCPSRSGQSAKLDPLYSRLTKAIRSANSQIMIVFEDYIASIVEQSGSGVARSPDPNATYAFHLYRPNWAQAKETLDGYIKHGGDLRVPLWLGEFDAFGANRLDKPPPGDWQALTRTLFEYLRAHGVSGWAYWAYRGTGSVFEGGGTTVNTELIRLLQTGF